MKKRIIENIKRLASIEYQRKHIVNGTVDDYESPRDMIYDTENSIDVVLNSKNLNNEFSETEVELLRKLKDILSNEKSLEPIFDDSISASMLVESDPKWEYIRSEARKTLKAIEPRPSPPSR
jgi:hypothetical protein